MSKGNMIKPIYSDETIGILNDIWIKKRIKEAHKLRARDKLVKLSDPQLVDYVIRLHNDKKKRKLKKREVKNGRK